MAPQNPASIATILSNATAFLVKGQNNKHCELYICGNYSIEKNNNEALVPNVFKTQTHLQTPCLHWKKIAFAKTPALGNFAFFFFFLQKHPNIMPSLLKINAIKTWR